MSVRFLKGIFLSNAGFALQDFEDCAIGDIVDTPFTFIGEEDTNDCAFDAATFIQRTS